MAQTSRFFDSVAGDRLYNSEEFSEYFEVLVDTGLIVGALNQLNPTVTGSNMIVTVDTGNSFINGRFYENDSSLDNTFDTETLGNDRIDLLVLRLDLNVGARIIDFQIVKGTPSVTPVAPTVTRNSTIHELALAEVFITGGQSFIQVGDLTDLREITTQASFFFPSAVSKVLPSIDQQAVDDNTERVAKYGVTTGSANAYLLTVNDVASYTDGLLINIKANFTNTGATTIDVNSLGTKNIFFKGSALPSGYISNAEQYSLIYDGTQFNLKSQPKITDADFINGEPESNLAKLDVTNNFAEDQDFDKRIIQTLTGSATSGPDQNVLNTNIQHLLYESTSTNFAGLAVDFGGVPYITVGTAAPHKKNYQFELENFIMNLDGNILYLRPGSTGILEQSTDGIVWEGVGGVKNIQRGFEASIGAGATVDKTLTSVVTNKTMANLLSTIGRGANTGISDTISIQLLNSTTLRIINNSTISFENISWEVIEYN